MKKNESKKTIENVKEVENSAVVSAPQEEENTFTKCKNLYVETLKAIKVNVFKKVDGLKKSDIDTMVTNDFLKSFESLHESVKDNEKAKAVIISYDVRRAIIEAMNDESNAYQKLMNVESVNADALKAFCGNVLSIAKDSLPKMKDVDKMFRLSADLLKTKHYEEFNENMKELLGVTFTDVQCEKLYDKMSKFNSKLEVQVLGSNALMYNVLGLIKASLKAVKQYEEKEVKLAWNDVMKAVVIIDEEIADDLKNTSNVLSIADAVKIPYDSKNVNYITLKQAVQKAMYKKYAVKPAFLK